MTEACATCGADDELLFTCRHCQRRFCERHELPHHACDRFSGASTGTDAEAAHSTTTETTGSAPGEPAASTETAAEPPTSPGPMDSRRAVGVVSPASSPQSLHEWLARQTYQTLLFKIGGLALLINVAFYGGVVLTLYDPLGLL